MDWIGGVVLVFMMLLTVADVILRYIGRPILGTYELVSLAGAVVIGCAMPHTSWGNIHVTVDMMLVKMQKRRQQEKESHKNRKVYSVNGTGKEKQPESLKLKKVN